MKRLFLIPTLLALFNTVCAVDVVPGVESLKVSQWNG